MEYREHTAVYRLNADGFIEILAVEILKRDASNVVLKARPLTSGNQIAVSGVALLRAAQLDAFADDAESGE